MWPRGRTIFDPRVIIWTILEEVHLVMQNNKKSRLLIGPVVSDKKIFHILPI